MYVCHRLSPKVDSWGSMWGAGASLWGPLSPQVPWNKAKVCGFIEEKRQCRIMALMLTWRKPVESTSYSDKERTVPTSRGASVEGQPGPAIPVWPPGVEVGAYAPHTSFDSFSVRV